MGTPYDQIVARYREVATRLVEQWGGHASTVASRVDAGPYKADCAAADLAKTASLATESAFLLASEALEAMSICADGRPGKVAPVESPPFHAPKGAKLRLVHDLEDGFGGTMPATVVPSELAAGETEFVLRADPATFEPSTYNGVVEATTPGPNPVTVSVPVWITFA